MFHASTEEQVETESTDHFLLNQEQVVKVWKFNIEICGVQSGKRDRNHAVLKTSKDMGVSIRNGVPPFLDGLPHGTSQSINGWGVTPFQETSIYENTKQFWASWIIWIGWTEASIPCPGSVSMPLTFRLVELWETSAVGWFAAWESFFLESWGLVIHNQDQSSGYRMI